MRAVCSDGPMRHPNLRRTVPPLGAMNGRPGRVSIRLNAAPSARLCCRPRRSQLHATWNSDGIDVRMRDLSLDGVSVYCGAALPIRRRVRIVGAVFDAVGEIVSTRQVGNVYTLRAHLIIAIFAVRTGGFVSTSA